MRTTPTIEPINKTSVQPHIAASRNNRPRARRHMTRRHVHSQLDQRLRTFFGTSFPMSAKLARLEDYIRNFANTGVRAGATEVYADVPMDPLTIFRDLRDRCRSAFGLPSAQHESYVAVGEAFAILRCCYYTYNASYQLEKDDIRWLRLRRCLQDLLLYHHGNETLPDYLKSAWQNRVALDSTPPKLREFYGVVIELGSEHLASHGEQSVGLRRNFSTLAN